MRTVMPKIIAAVLLLSMLSTSILAFTAYAPEKISITACTNTTYPLQIQNSRAANTTITLETRGILESFHKWKLSTFTLPESSYTNIEGTLTIPCAIPEGNYNITTRITDTLSAKTKELSQTITIIAGAPANLTTHDYHATLSCTPTTLPFVLKNTEQYDDVYTITVESPKKIGVTYPTTLNVLGQSEAQDTINITPKDCKLSGKQQLTITAVSEKTGAVITSATTLDILNVGDSTITAHDATLNTSAILNFTIHNNGGEETYHFNITAPPFAHLNTTESIIQENMATILPITLTITNETTPGTHKVQLTTTSKRTGRTTTATSTITIPKQKKPFTITTRTLTIIVILLLLPILLLLSLIPRMRSATRNILRTTYSSMKKLATINHHQTRKEATPPTPRKETPSFLLPLLIILIFTSIGTIALAIWWNTLSPLLSRYRWWIILGLLTGALLIILLHWLTSTPRRETITVARVPQSSRMITTHQTPSLFARERAYIFELSRQSGELLHHSITLLAGSVNTLWKGIPVALTTARKAISLSWKITKKVARFTWKLAKKAHVIARKIFRAVYRTFANLSGAFIDYIEKASRSFLSALRLLPWKYFLIVAGILLIAFLSLTAYRIELSQQQSSITTTAGIPVQLWEQNKQHSLDLTRYFQDPDGDTLKYAYTPAPNITIEIANGIALFTPQQDYTGNQTVTFIAVDKNGERATSNEVLLIVTTPANKLSTRATIFINTYQSHLLVGLAIGILLLLLVIVFRK